MNIAPVLYLPCCPALVRNNRDSDRVHRPGVTLLETVLAVVILSVAMVATSALVRPGVFASSATRGAAGDAASLLRFARQDAILKRSAVDVELVSKGGVQHLFITVQPNAFDSGSQVLWPLASTVQVTGTPTRIRFLPSGDADSSLRWDLIDDSSRRELQVLAAGGIVQQR
ncbi:hypothetical protein FF011L_00350 [Roseimaritima multifibrata]|uniref:General secretion pathway GspH domain-containing protein n=1 Tax=Roseimaritima multifibrata TaxID=1930274 RepID=A0A517M8U0_9BACT|nr:GspH/FimT family pseudopilin [Roseimaritima multifibrata]QDS91306.1 hypothetical protein FF011L_00350 [Roseimaritima multifibrata]